MGRDPRYAEATVKPILPELGRLALCVVLVLVALLCFTFAETARSVPEARSVRHTPAGSASPAYPAPISPVISTRRLSYGGVDGKGYKNTYLMTMAGETTVISQGESRLSTIVTEMALTQDCVPQSADLLRLTTKVDTGSISVNGTRSPIPMVGKIVKQRWLAMARSSRTLATRA
jgi:hypothetical protein